MALVDLLSAIKALDLGTITITSIGGFITGAFVLRKMYSDTAKTDAETVKIQNETMVAQFTTITQGYEHQTELMRLAVDRVNEEIALVRGENRRLANDVSELSTANAHLRADNESLRKANAELMIKLDELKHEVTRLLEGMKSARECSLYPHDCPTFKALSNEQGRLPGV